LEERKVRVERGEGEKERAGIYKREKDRLRRSMIVVVTLLLSVIPARIPFNNRRSHFANSPWGPLPHLRIVNLPLH
jgi:hypothetical protein